MKSTIDLVLAGDDVRYLQGGENRDVVLITKGDDSVRLDEAIVDRIAEIAARRSL